MQKNNRELIELILFVLLTFTVILLLRSSFNRCTGNIPIKVPEVAAATEHNMLDSRIVPTRIQN